MGRDSYKKQGVKPPLAKAVETVIETGDFHVTTVGDNLPNENEIHEKYGSKSFLFTGSHARLRRTPPGQKSIEEFARIAGGDRRAATKYGDEAEDLLTALHEIIGHGSGKLESEADARAPESYLKEYFSTLEEARADLMALWNVFDPKLKELGLISSPDEVAKAMYDAAARVVLTQLRRIPKGDTIEEDHERDRQLIVNYIMDKTGAIAKEERDGKTYVAVRDYDKMRQGVGMLLAELMRIKAEGDYDAIKALVEPVRRALRSGAARPGGGALQEAEPADLLGRHQCRSDAAVRRQGRSDRRSTSRIRAISRKQQLELRGHVRQAVKPRA